MLDELSRIPGVGQALLFARLNYSMRVWFDVQRLISLNLTPARRHRRAYSAQNVQAAVGRIGAPPIDKDQQIQLNVQTQGRLTTPEQFGDIVLRANPDGSILHLRDVARVELGAQNSDIDSRLDGEPTVAAAIYLAPGANAVSTAALVNETLDQLSQRFPKGMKAKVVFDSTTFVNDTIREVIKTLSEAFALVVLVVFLFMGNLRATIIPAVAVPVSLIGTFVVLLRAGLLGQHRLAAGDGAGDRHRGRRRDRGGGERRARDRGGARTDAGRGHQEGDAPDHRAGHRHHLGAAVGVRADRLRSGPVGRCCFASSPSPSARRC